MSEVPITDTLGSFAPVLEDTPFDFIQMNELDAPYWLPELNLVKVISVYDGDTFHVLGKPKNGDGNVYKFVVRLNGIDTPEMNSKNAKEHEDAVKARDELRNLIEGEIVQLQKISKDKYGRLLSYVYLYDRTSKDFTQNVTQLMLDQKLGYEYHGGKKRVVIP